MSEWPPGGDSSCCSTACGSSCACSVRPHRAASPPAGVAAHGAAAHPNIRLGAKRVHGSGRARDGRPRRPRRGGCPGRSPRRPGRAGAAAVRATPLRSRRGRRRGVPSGVLAYGRGRHVLRHPRGRRSQPQRHDRVVGARGEHARLLRRPRPRAGRSGRPSVAARGCGRRGTCARRRTRWQYTLTYHAPVAKNTDRRVDLALGQLVATGRPVVDVEPFVMAAPRRVPRPGTVARPLRRRARGGRARLPAGRARSRAVRPGRSPGTASSAAAGGQQREALGRREAQRAAEVVGEADRDPAARRPPRRRGSRPANTAGTPIMSTRSRSSASCSSVIPNRCASSSFVRAGMGDDPRHEREDPLHLRLGDRARAHRRLTSHAAGARGRRRRPRALRLATALRRGRGS